MPYASFWMLANPATSERSESLLSFREFYHDHECRKALYKSENGNLAAMQLLYQRNYRVKAERAEFKKKAYAPFAQFVE